LWIAGRALSVPAASAASARSGRTRQPPADPSGTTLEATVRRADNPGYARLGDGPGWPTVVRDELAAPRSSRENDRRALAAVVHLTDIHLIDAQSTGRVEFLDPDGEPFTAAFRPQECMTTHVASSMVERINALAGGPVTGRPFDCAVSTGDNIDNQQLNETRWFLRVLDGGRLAPNSGLADTYEGVQDDVLVDPAYWHPEPGITDRWKTDLGYPDVPGLLAAAIRPYETPALGIPWYSTYGNHDGLIQGTIPTTEAIERVLVDRWKMTGLPPGAGAVAFIAGVAAAPPDQIVAQLGYGTYPARVVTCDADRRTV
jgi:metallophosphoesterase (TIGR03767 family)